MSPPPSPSPPPALPWLLAACCLCALPRGSGFPQPFARYRDGAELPKSQQLALCFSQWMELSHQPQISSTVLDLCYSIFNSMHTNEVRCNCFIYLKASLTYIFLQTIIYNLTLAFKTIIESILTCFSPLFLPVSLAYNSMHAFLKQL
uniref:Neuromedin-S n=1 Tax=Anas platyrhynchos TaxID=8839 RepID=A0A8B9QRY8_ANAPL